MKNKLLLPLLVLLAGAVSLLWWMGQGPAAEPAAPPPGLDPGESLVAGGPTSVLPEVQAPEAEGAEREEVEAAPEEEDREVVARRKPVGNAVWLPGRVVFPEQMPNDAGEATVTARGRRFSEKSSRREHSVDVERDGSFRVAISKESRKAWVDLRGRYLYLDDRVRLDMEELPDELVLEPSLGGIVSGVVRAPRGLKWTEAARDGAHVRINAWGGGRSVSRSSRIDEEGRFELSGLPPRGSYMVRVELPLWCDTYQRDVAVKSGEVTDLDLEIEQGSTIAGRVVDRNEVGLGGVPVELSGEPTDGSWMRDQLMTEKDGSFVFRGVKDGDVTLKAVRDESLPVEQELGRVAGGSRREGIVLRIADGDSIEGVVRWPDGSPATNATVSISQDRETDGLMFNWNNAVTEKTDGEGRFAISGLEPSICQVRAAAKSFRPKELEKAKQRAAEGREYKLRARGPVYKVRVDDVQPGTTGLVLVLGEGSSISGRALDDLGEGLGRFLVTAEPVEGTGVGLEDEDAISRMCISLDGSFTVDGLQDGDWKIRAKSKDHEISNEVAITVPGSAEIELVSNRFSEVLGVVRDPGGEPVSGARIFIDHLDEDEAFELQEVRPSWGEEATTDQNGAFRARDVAPGRLRIGAHAEGFASSLGRELRLDPGATLEGVSLQLRRPARIRGQLHASITPQADRRIQVRVDGGGRYWGNSTTDDGGAFELDELDAGSYRLTLQAPDDPPEGYLERDVVEVVSVDDGETRTVLMGAPPPNPTTVSGRVLSGGGPAVGVVVKARASEEGELDNDATRTDGDGRYALTLRGSGTYNFKVGNPERGMLSSRHDLQAGDNPGLDFHLSVGRISGQVRDKDGELFEGVRMTLMAVELADEKAKRPSPRTVSTDEEGRYEFDAVAAGTYSLRAEDRSRRSWRRRGQKKNGTELRQGLVVPEQGTLENVDFDLEMEGTIRVEVTGPGGGPVSASIKVETLDGGDVRGRRFRASKEGTVSIGLLAPGRYRVNAAHDGSTSQWVEVRVVAGEDSQLQLDVD